ncbi:MAG: energy transducer TonB [Acidobacteriota bacterium]|jgi:TonB family protein
MTIDYRSVLMRLREWASGPPTQASLFHFTEGEHEPSVFQDLWCLLRHPIHSFREERQAPRTRASLFHYLEKPGEAEPLNWTDLLKDLLTGYRFALFIPSLWSDHALLAEERAELRTRRMEAGVASLVIHLTMMSLALFVALNKLPEQPPPQKESVVFINTPMHMPFVGEDRDGGGGGGGKHEKLPASGGRLPDAARVQIMPPDPGMPKPLVPSDNPLDAKPSVQMPIDLPTDSFLPIGDITAPTGGPPSSGPGTGDGIGTGSGTGDGSGKGPGAGSGENGGFGKGRDGGIGDRIGPHIAGDGLTLPEPILKPTPYYTEEARKARTEGIVVLQVTIRANGTVDGFKVIKGLGYGLNEATINTIASKWKFKPATYHGVPIDFQASIEVTFRLY